MVSLLLCIGQLPALHGDTNCAFAFWVGMDPGTQLKILHLCASCPTLDTLAFFRDPKNWKDSSNSLSLWILGLPNSLSLW